MKCNHENAVIPIYDNTYWKIGDICTLCKKVWLREIPNYEKRLMDKHKRLKGEI